MYLCFPIYFFSNKKKNLRVIKIGGKDVAQNSCAGKIWASGKSSWHVLLLSCNQTPLTAPCCVVCLKILCRNLAIRKRFWKQLLDGALTLRSAYLNFLSLVYLGQFVLQSLTFAGQLEVAPSKCGKVVRTEDHQRDFQRRFMQ